MTPPDIGSARPSGDPEREDVHIAPDGRRLGWSEWGPTTGRPVLLLHGMPGSSHLCPDVTATHELDVRLIAPDRPGYGRSDVHPGRRLMDDAADTAFLLDQLDVAAAAVIGWSGGSAFAVAMAGGFPERVTRVSLVAPLASADEWPEGDPDAERRARVAAIRRDPVAERAALQERLAWFAADPGSILDAAGGGPSTGAGPTAEDDPDGALRTRADVRSWLLEMFRYGGRAGAEGWVDDTIAVGQPWGVPLAEITRPVTVWFGGQDDLADRRDAELLATRIPRARLHVLRGEGHLLPVRQWRPILEDALVEDRVRT